MKAECFRGTVFYKSRSVLLRICSRSLYKVLKGKRASVKSFRNGSIVLKKDLNGTKFQRTGKNAVVTIAVTKHIDKSIVYNLPVKVYFQGFRTTNVVQNDVAQKSSLYSKKDIPRKLYWIKAFLRNNKRGMKVTLHRKAMTELAKNSSTRVLFQPIDKGIILRKTHNVTHGRKLYSHAKAKNNSHVTEIAYPRELENRFTGHLGIPIEEFGIKLYKFSMNVFEGKLLAELERKGLNVNPGTTQTIGDILLPNGSYVEVTNFNPNTKKDSRHASSVMQIRGRIFEAEHLSIHRKIKPIFIVINNSWKRNRHLQEELIEAKKLNVYMLFTDFKSNWEKPIASNILNTYNQYS